MNSKLEAALAAVDTTYFDIIEVVNDTVKPITKGADDLINIINSNINNLSIEQIRDYILQLQLKAFELSEIKEKAAMKAELAEALQKEKYATSFNALEGSAAVKDKLAAVEAAPEVVSEVFYNLIANLFKTKLDQLHRLVAALTSILMSRGQELKFMNLGASGEIPATTDGKTIL